jgi:chromosomal replication initiation ATPase DnaA
MGKSEDFSKVIKVVTELTDVTEQEVLSKSRVKEVVDARWMAIYFLKMKGYCTN